MITVVITTWVIPFEQVVRDIQKFETPGAALDFINAKGKEWWDENNGDQYITENPDCEDTIPYEPIAILGYDTPKYNIAGEREFHALLDAESEAELHEAYYKVKYDDKGLTRPGYLINCYVAEGPDGEHVSGPGKYEEYYRQQQDGMQKLYAYHNPH